MLLDTFADRATVRPSPPTPRAKADTQIANEGRDVNAQLGRRVVGGCARDDALDGRFASVQDVRFQGGDGPRWGINFARRIRRKNEIATGRRVARLHDYRASSEGNLEGCSRSAWTNLRIKPVLRGSSSAALANRSSTNDPAAAWTSGESRVAQVT